MEEQTSDKTWRDCIKHIKTYRACIDNYSKREDNAVEKLGEVLGKLSVVNDYETVKEASELILGALKILGYQQIESSGEWIDNDDAWMCDRCEVMEHEDQITDGLCEQCTGDLR